jgi:hypothetical protein
MLQERIKNVLSLKPGRFSFGMRGAARVLAICLCCIVPILAITCATKPEVVKEDNALFSTWVNAEYEGKAPAFSAKFVTFPDGRQLDYLKIADTTPEWESRFTIEETWIDAEGNHWYKSRWTTDYYPYKEARFKGYGLIRISASGTVWEGVGAEAGYPEELSPIGGQYGIYHRQE